MPVESLKKLLTGIIDYAGLFPPASLSLNQSLKDFSTYQKDPHHWMLSRFISPANKLLDITFGKETLSIEHVPYRFSVLINHLGGREEFLNGVRHSFKEISEFVERYPEEVITDALEIKLTEDSVDVLKPNGVYDLLGAVSDAILSSVFFKKTSKIEIYYEFSPSSDNLTAQFFKGVQKHNFRFNRTDPYPGASFKLRTGGVKTEDFPEIKAISHAILSCRDNFIPFKATAGLHHPIRRFDKGVNTKMHGFLNVFGGGVLAHARAISGAQLEEILNDEKEDNFSFEKESFSWKNLRVSTSEIINSRQLLMRSFGSCSFLEPKEDLQRLELL